MQDFQIALSRSDIVSSKNRRFFFGYISSEKHHDSKL